MLRIILIPLTSKYCTALIYVAMYTKNSILHHVLIHVGEETSLSFELMDTKGSAICQGSTKGRFLELDRTY